MTVQITEATPEQIAEYGASMPDEVKAWAMQQFIEGLEILGDTVPVPFIVYGVGEMAMVIALRAEAKADPANHTPGAAHAQACAVMEFLMTEYAAAGIDAANFSDN